MLANRKRITDSTSTENKRCNQPKNGNKISIHSTLYYPYPIGKKLINKTMSISISTQLQKMRHDN